MRSSLAIAALLSAATASPYAEPDSISNYIRAAADTPSGKATRAKVEPCAAISAALAQAPTPSLLALNASVALQCLRSVPLDKKNAPAQVLGIDTLTDFQSTLAYLKDPPPGWQYPAVDFKAGLKKIGAAVENNEYDNEYDFQDDIGKLVSSTYDFHFNYPSDITQIFYFQREFGIFSFSKDGVSLPEVYSYLDLNLITHSNYTNYTASPIIKINGKPVETFLNDLATAEGVYEDPDANYNSIFPNVALDSNYQSDSPIWMSSSHYQGTDTVLTFKNGSSTHILTFATTSDDFTGVTDGRSFFQKFCAAKSPTSSSAIQSFSALPSSLIVSSSASISGIPSSVLASASATALSSEVLYSAVPSQTALPAPSAFPKPWVIAHDRSVACYFPADNQDLAVLMVPTFGPINNVEFSDVTRQCLATSSKLRKTKFMIDLRGNGGGSLIMAYDMFKQIFPSMTPWGTSNLRAFDLFNDIGKIVTAEYAGTTPENATPDDYNTDFSTPFNAREEFDKMNKDFSSWADFYGPVHTHGDTFTNLVRYNLSDPYQTSNISVSGYNNGYVNLKGVPPKQTFAVENIVLLEDGECGSTCALFAEFMKTQGKVPSIVWGGRSQYGPMQGVCGSKGAEVWAADYIYQIATEAFTAAPKAQAKALINKYGVAAQAVEYAIARCPSGDEGSYARVNVRNNIRKGDTTLTPLQFVYEAADCRLFYTPQMYADQTILWKTAYKAQWGNGKCVKGSTGQDSSDPGTDYILASPDGSTTASPSASSSSGPSSSGKSNAPPAQSSTLNAGGRIGLGFGGLTVMMSAFGFAFMLL